MTHAVGEIFAGQRACEALRRTGDTLIPAPLRCPRKPLGLHVSTRPAMFAEMSSEILERDASGETSCVRRTGEWTGQRSGLSEHGLLGRLFIGEEGFQYGM